MNLEVSRIPKTDFKLIPVANELVSTGVQTISCDGQKWLIVDRYTFKKDEYIPRGFLLFVIGQHIDLSKIWEAYPKSDALIIFVCQPFEDEEVENVEEPPKENEIEQKTEGVPDIFSK